MLVSQLEQLEIILKFTLNTNMWTKKSQYYLC